ncbi:MAG: hypothetical protein NUW02_01430 [Candidatus Campbellbacteria bacterium]|nr:hypothetical protein [Candidatus Campbellbacteria bacterium]
MEETKYTEETIVNNPAPRSGSNPIPLAILVAGVLIAGAMWFRGTGGVGQLQATGDKEVNSQVLAFEESIIPSEGVVLPATWGDLGAKLVSVGAIDVEKLKTTYDQRGALPEGFNKLLLEQNNGKLKITRENSAYLLNLLWALGLASDNSILESGEMSDPKYGGAQNFTSTAGWTIAQGNPMDHYSKHRFFNLTPEQQALVDKVSRGIFRPCCGNSTHFPDCNHGMAMLGLLELMASQGVSEEDMYKAALAVNSYWFPDTYRTIATYMKNKGIAWANVSPSEVLGAQYSSGTGYAKIKAQVTQPQQQQGGGGCSV